MNTAEDDIHALLGRLPDNCFEDAQYHLYVIEKVKRGIERAEAEGTVPEEDVERRLSRWAFE